MHREDLRVFLANQHLGRRCPYYRAGCPVEGGEATLTCTRHGEP